MKSDTLQRLQSWYAGACDGTWEHAYGVKIDTLDNPGWSVEIDLVGTPLESIAFHEVSDLKPELEWVRCWVEGGKFRRAGGPQMLGRIFDIFLGWAERDDNQSRQRSRPV